MDRVHFNPADIPVLQNRINCAKIELRYFAWMGPTERRSLEHKITRFQALIKYLEGQFDETLGSND